MMPKNQLSPDHSQGLGEKPGKEVRETPNSWVLDWR